MKFGIKEILLNRHAIQTIALIVIHQSIIASSALFLTKLIDQFNSGLPYLSYLALYFLSMALPFVPGCASFWTLTNWQNSTHAKYVHAVASKISGRIDLYRSSEMKDEVVGILSRNSFGIVALVCTYLHGSLSFLLNSSLSIIVIGFILPSDLALGYAISAVLSAAIIIFASPAIARRSANIENSNISYGNDLGKAWGNLTIDNAYNRMLWENGTQASGSRYYDESKKLSLIRQANNFLLGMIALIPTMYLIYQISKTGSAAPAVIAAIIVNLTRVIHILNSFSELIYQILDLKGVLSRLLILSNILTRLDNAAPTLPIRPSGLVFINNSPIVQYEPVIDEILQEKTGRFTITGANGSGKSTFLACLKIRLGQRGFFLPSNTQELTWKSREHAASTGQQMLSVLREVTDVSRAQYLLLDEWDSNLDTQNKRTIDEWLDQLSSTCVIVEVRHGLDLLNSRHPTTIEISA